MILVLHLTPDKRAELDAFLADLHDPASSHFHRWLTPEEFKERFSPSSDDIDMILHWLRSHGFAVEDVARGSMWINFSGAVVDVERAFHTRIHDYDIEGRLYHGNVQDPSIPRAFSGLVAGVVSLHNFPRKMMNSGAAPIAQRERSPDYTIGSTHYLSPADFATIYNVNALYSTGIDGSGQSIAIVGRTHPPSSNWAIFRSMMGLSANPPQVIVNGQDPGSVSADENFEADLDVEWSGAVAKNASILFVVSKSTQSTDGVDLSAQYIVNNNLSPVMSTSFGSCESDLGTSGNIFYNNLWQQAAAQGITSFVSSGDSGAAGCNIGSDPVGSGRAVNGLASTQYNVSVGGTEFSEGTGTYWNSTNGSGYSSAISYIPEVAWNESCVPTGCLWATGGGSSSKYSKPSWQVSPGVPADGKRDVPDVALSAAGHDAYLVVSQNGGLYAVSGTSASSPSFAGLMALVVQKTGQRQGNANSRFYQLGNSQYGSGGAVVFHDTISGNNTVPGVTGYTSATGYDLATGLGSVDASALVNNWTPDFTIAASPSALSIAQGSSGTLTISATTLGNFNNTVSLSAPGLPTGTTATFSPSSIGAPGAGNSTLTLTVGSSSPAGTYAVTITGIGGGLTHSTTVSLSILQAFTVTSSVNGTGGTISPSSSTVVGGDSVTLTVSPAIGYHLATLFDNGIDVMSSVSSGNYIISDITANHTVVATFAINTYAVNASIIAGQGSVIPASGIVDYGSPVTFTITPDADYSLQSLTDNGSSVSATPAGNGSYTYTIAGVTADHTLQITFAQAAVTVPAIGFWGFLAAAGALGFSRFLF
ncbi:MAG TPA: protease pro-enzyme activation domain-containing protein [Thermodesulfovibrionales bacterium]|nr:protease pro-enzyme activation domain-containing protein [Thermodesulfovibrionales bacterium]